MKPLVWILGLALVCRLIPPLLVVVLHGDETALRGRDTPTYIDLAASLAAGEGFAIGGQVQYLRTPGYPLLLVPAVLSGQVEWVAVGLQVLLSCVTVFLVYRCALLYWGHTAAALAAGLLYAIEPLSVVFSSMLLTETLFTLGVVAFLFFFFKWSQNARLQSLLWAALALAATAYVRPISQYLPPLVGGILAWKLRVSWRQLGQVGAFVLLGVGLVGVWQVRNLALVNYFGVSAIADVNLYFYQAAAVRAAVEDKPYAQIQEGMGYRDPEIYFGHHPEQRQLDRADQYRWMRGQALGILLQHPGIYAGIHLQGMARVLLDPGAIDMLRLLKRYPAAGGVLAAVLDEGLGAALVKLARERPLAVLCSLLFGVVLLVYFACALLGLRGRGDKWDSQTLVMLLLVTYFLLLSGGANGVGRFRHPIMPLVCIWAGSGLVALVGRGQTRGRHLC